MINPRTRTLLTATALIGLIIAARLLPHAPNFAPVAAVALVSALYLPTQRAWLIPLIGMLISDLFIGFYHLPVMLTVYGCFAVIYLFGRVLARSQNAINTLTTALLASVFFFAVTNCAVWLFGDLYPLTVDGALLAYTLAIPFFKSTLASDLIYVTILVGIFELVPALTASRATVRVVRSARA